ncbi:hypothetical protein ACI75Y_09505 [Capnocytophaga stomatis]
MKQIMKNSLIGIGLYLLTGIVFYGYQGYMLPTFLLLMAMVSFLSFKKKERKEVRSGLFWMNLPILSLLFVTSLFTDSFVIALPYLIFTPLVSILVYYAIFPTKRIIFFGGILILIIASFFAFNLISGNTEAFDSSYWETYSRLVKR